MAKSHRCTELAYDVSCIFNVYLNTCIKASATAVTSDPEGRTPASFQFIIAELNHECYRGRPLPTSLHQLLLAQDNKRAEAARDSRQPPPPDGGGRSGGGGAAVTRGVGDTPAPSAPRRSSPEGNLLSNPRAIPHLQFLTFENTQGICRNVAFPIVGGADFCK